MRRWTPEMLARRERILGPNPWGGHGHNALGCELFRMNAWARAVSEFEKAAEINPWKAQFKINLARALLALGDARKAKRILMAALKQAPKDPDGLFAMGMISEKLGERAEAIAWYKLCILAKPSWGIRRDAEENIEILVKSGHDESS